MDQLFAPWRIDWVERDPDETTIDGCPFCVLPDRDTDRESRIVARSERSFALLNNYPYNPGHLMIIPYRHIGDYEALSPADLLDHARLKQVAIDALDAGLDPDGLNMGMNIGDGAGGSIDDHLHTHIVPRWEGDTNFMPVVGDAKVIVEAVDDTYERLHEGFAAQPGAVGGDEQAVEFDFDLAVDDA
ncbi:MAG: HIT domain-containing protein [Haloarculaceae archaeon]